MAYGNWGAFVFCDGERRKDKEDVYAFDVGESNQASQGVDLSSHAVLGDKEIRLCAYKNYPRLWRFKDGKVKTVDLKPFLIPEESTEYNKTYIGEVDGFAFIAHQYDDNMVDLTLVEPDGTKWKSTCGMSYGAGYMD